MKISYQIDEEDMLVYQLYAASKSDIVKKNRAKNKILSPLLFAGFAIAFLFVDREMSVYFFIFTVTWFFLFPIWEKRIFIKNCRNVIRTNFKDRLSKDINFEFDTQQLILNDGTSETRVSSTEVDSINEIPSTIFVKLKNNTSFILPKSKIVDIDGVKTELKHLATYLNIQYNLDENWGWG